MELHDDVFRFPCSSAASLQILEQFKELVLYVRPKTDSELFLQLILPDMTYGLV